MPVAPPNEIFTSPPRARTASIWSRAHACLGSYALNHMALQAEAVMNASVTFLRLPPATIVVRLGVGQAPMSTYGACASPPVAGGCEVGGVVGGVVGVVVGGVPPSHAPRSSQSEAAATGFHPAPGGGVCATRAR